MVASLRLVGWVPAFAGMTRSGDDERAWMTYGRTSCRPDLKLRLISRARPSLPPGCAALIFNRMQTVITVTLNGETRALDGPVSVAGLLLTLGLEGRKVAVERNEAIVPRSRYTETMLASGDSLEIVHFIGGG